MAIYKNTAELMGVIHSNLCDRMISQRLTFRTTLEKEDTGATIWIEKKGADQRLFVYLNTAPSDFRLAGLHIALGYKDDKSDYYVEAVQSESGSAGGLHVGKTALAGIVDAIIKRVNADFDIDCEVR